MNCGGGVQPTLRLGGASASSTFGPTFCKVWIVTSSADKQTQAILDAVQAGQGSAALGAAQEIEEQTRALIVSADSQLTSVTQAPIWDVMVRMSSAAIAFQTAGMQGDPAEASSQALHELASAHSDFAGLGPMPSACG